MAKDEGEEKLFVIPLKELKVRRMNKRSSQAVVMVRRYIARHMKAEEEDIWIDPRINELIWKRGIQKPPKFIRVKVSQLEEEGKIGVELPKEMGEEGEVPPEKKEEKKEEDKGAEKEETSREKPKKEAAPKKKE